MKGNVMFIIYKTTNTMNNKIYIGAHKMTDVNDTYFGSGKLLRKALQKYGQQAFKREILFIFESEKEMYDKEREIVDESFISRTDTYNIKIGGLGGMGGVGMFINIETGTYESLGLGDSRIGVTHLGASTYINQHDGSRIHTHKLDDRLKDGCYKSQKSGKSLYWDNVENKDVFIDNDNVIPERHSAYLTFYCVKSCGYVKATPEDPRIKLGELLYLTKGCKCVFDVSKEAIVFTTKSDAKGNPNYKELSMFKDKDGNVVRTHCDDVRVKTGELVGITKGASKYFDTVENKYVLLNKLVAQNSNGRYVGTSVYINKDTGEVFNAHKLDERLKSDKIIHILKDRVEVEDNEGNIKKISKYHKLIKDGVLRVI